MADCFTIPLGNWTWLEDWRYRMERRTPSQSGFLLHSLDSLAGAIPLGLQASPSFRKSKSIYGYWHGRSFFDLADHPAYGPDCSTSGQERLTLFDRNERAVRTLYSDSWRPSLVSVGSAAPPVYNDHLTYLHGTSVAGTSFSTPQCIRAQLSDKIEFYHDVRQSIEEEIGLLKYDYLFDESTEFVQSQRDKLAIVNSVIEQLQFLQQDAFDPIYLATFAKAELRASAFADLYALRFSRSKQYLHAWGAGHQAKCGLLFHAMFGFLRHGQIFRLLFRIRPVDIRRRFRTLVRILFKQMDDQSGHDDFLALDQLSARIFSSTNICFLYEYERNDRRA